MGHVCSNVFVQGGRSWQNTAQSQSPIHVTNLLRMWEVTQKDARRALAFVRMWSRDGSGCQRRKQVIGCWGATACCDGLAKAVWARSGWVRTRAYGARLLLRRCHCWDKVTRNFPAASSKKPGQPLHSIIHTSCLCMTMENR